VLAYAAGDVFGDAGIQCAIAAFENIEKPVRVLSRALFFQRNHCIKILTKKDANIKTILLRQRTTRRVELTDTVCYSASSMKSVSDILLPIIGEIKANKKTIEVSELWGASKALFLSGLHRESGRPLVVVTSTEEESATLLEDLKFFMSTIRMIGTEASKTDILGFPTWGVLPFEADSPDSRTVGERMRFLYSLISGTIGIYVAPIQALMLKLPPWDLFADSVKTVTNATQIDPESLVAALVSTGY